MKKTTIVVVCLLSVLTMHAQQSPALYTAIRRCMGLSTIVDTSKNVIEDLSKLCAFLYTRPFVAATTSSSSSELAFEGAEGPGAYAKGGKGGKILYVTTLEDTGKEGSFRWALMQDYPRIVKFKVGGIFSLNDNIKVKTPYLTIDGSDAPSPVTIIDGTLTIQTNDVIIRYIRVRPGDSVVLKKGRWARQKRAGSPPHDGICVQKSSNVIIDHCSVSWSSDEVLSAASEIKNVTVQWCFIYEPLANSKLHVEDGQEEPHAKGALENGENVAYIKNLIAYFKDRGPQMGSGTVSAINNVICFYENSGTRITPDVGDTLQAVVLNNVYKNRLYDTAPDIHLVPPKGGLPSGKGFSMYIAGNVGPLRTSTSMDEWAGVNIQGWPSQTIKAWRASKPPFAVVPLKLIATDKVFNEVLASGGATLPTRDKHDSRVVNNIKAGKGKVIFSQDDVGGYQI